MLSTDEWVLQIRADVHGNHNRKNACTNACDHSSRENCVE